MNTRLINTIAPIIITFFILWMNSFVDMNPDWYKKSKKPWFLPPTWVFPVVWTITYIYFIYLWIQSQNLENYPIISWICTFNIIVNGFWTIMFFGLKKMYVAFGLIVLLILINVSLLLLVRDTSHIVYTFLHILWLLYALLINMAMIQMN